ncbi:MAG TPA: glucoamylase family protein [Eubacteriales bacterium]|nr:glucoamylase family protein [Eubacteriales bacterium]
MVYFFIIFAALTFGYLIFRAERRLLYGDINCNIGDEEFVREVKALSARSLLPVKGGRGVAADFGAEIKRAYHMLSKKAKMGELFECEKWLYDNHFVIMRAQKKIAPKTFSTLPHIAGEPRILKLANLIVDYSAGKVTKERVDMALSAFENRLHYNELCSLSDALHYILLQKIADASKRVLHYNRLYRLGMSFKNLVRRFFRSSFCKSLTYKRQHSVAARMYRYFNKGAFDSFDGAFAAMIRETNIVTERAVSSLHTLDESLADLFVRFEPLSLMSEDKTFNKLTEQSKHIYLKQIAKLSDKINIGEEVFTKRLLSLSKLHGVDPYSLLFFHKRELMVYAESEIIHPLKEDYAPKRRAKLFIALNVALTLIFAAVPAIFVPAYLIAPVFLLTAAALYPLVSNVLIGIFLHFLNSLELPEIDKAHLGDADALVVVSLFIATAEQFKDAALRALKARSVNAEKNINFSLLIDLPAADTVETALDAEISDALDTLKSELGKEAAYLPAVLIRKRIYDGKRFSAHERKRGAIEALNEALCSGDFSAFSCVSEDVKKPKYVILLDDDSVIEPSAAARAVAVMEHPANGYELLNFINKYNLYALETPYSTKFACAAGRDTYNRAEDFYFKLSGDALFSGKGIYRLDTFREKLHGAIPENRVLSHDILEGAMLKTAVCPVAVYEDAPKDFFEDEQRRERWTRGDVQLLPFVLSKKYRKNLNAAAKFVMLQNAFKPLSAFSLFALGIMAAGFLNLPLAITFAAIAVLPLILSLGHHLLSLISGKTPLYAFLGAARSVFEFATGLLLLPYFAVKDFAVFMIAAARMARKKNLLQWRTFFQCKGKFEPLSLIAPTFFTLALISTAAFFLDNLRFFISLLVIAAAALGFLIVFLAGVKRENKNSRLKKAEQKLLKICEKTYEYFKDNAIDNLISDNYQIEHEVGLAKQTSPTNIGYSLIAEIAAEALGIIPPEESAKRALDILSAAAALKKWKGHLYNWYDIKTKEVMPPRFVSSVDSGNFAAALIAVKGHYKESFPDVALKAEELLDAIDFSALYDNKKRLFYIGRSEERGFLGHYDLLASEARLLSYIGAAYGVDSRHFEALSREHTPLLGNTLYSWNGTAFEYFMPDIFLSPPKGSLLAASSKHAALWQKIKKCKSLFGISESAYFAFDPDLKLQYKAFGLSEVALRSSLDKCVITPYASALMLEKSPRAVLKNLSKIETRGAFGKYGFYEAIDYESNEHIVKSFMAHHQGMILAAIANAFASGVIRKAFEKDIKISGAKMLLTEPQITVKGEKKRKNRFVYSVKEPAAPPEIIAKKLLFPRCAVLKGRDYITLLDDFGQGVSVSKGRDINRFRRDMLTPYGGFLYATEDGAVFSPTFAPLRPPDHKFSAAFTDTSAYFENESKGISQEIFTPGHIRGELRRFKAQPKAGGGRRKLKIAYFSELSMMDRGSDLMHANFCDMFVTSRVEENLIIFERKFTNSEAKFYVAAMVEGVKNLLPVLDREVFLGREGGIEHPDAVFKTVKETTGDLLAPCIGFTAEIEIEEDKPAGFELTIIAADTLEELKSSLNRAKFQNAFVTDSREKLPMAYTLKLQSGSAAYFNSLVAKLLYIPFPSDSLAKMSEGELSELRFMTDGFKKKLIYYRKTPGSSFISELTIMLQYLSELCLPAALIIEYGEQDGYFRPVNAEIGSEIKYGTIGKDIFLTETDKSKFAFIIADPENDVKMNEYVENFSPPVYLKAEKIEQSGIVLSAGEGGFGTAGEYIIRPYGKRTLLPYSNVIAGRAGGFVTTENGGGFTYFLSSQEGKLTRHSYDFVTDPPSELVYLASEEGVLRLNGGENITVTHDNYLTEFSFRREREMGTLSAYTAFSGGAKVYLAEFLKAAKRKLIFWLKCELGAADSKDYWLIKLIRPDLISVKNLRTNVEMFAKVFGGRFVLNGNELLSRVTGGLSAFGGSFYFPEVCAVINTQGKRALFSFGGDLKAVDAAEEELLFERAQIVEKANSLGAFTLDTGVPELDILFNKRLMYQITASRLDARAGFYQTGGAIGFRDQLQDSLALLFGEPERVKEMILKAASHQYSEGDVMHWWHSDRRGVRTRITDDRLFLAYVAAKYIETTGDAEILDEKIPFLISDPLFPAERSRYEQPEEGEDAPLLEHILRALMSERIGENGLVLMGGGDWNDALDECGDSDRGESVWLSMFYCMVLKEVIPYFGGAAKLELVRRLESVKRAVENTWDGDRYKRLVTKDGEWIGGKGARIELDLITQAFSALSGICDKERVKTALDTARGLVDVENKLIKITDKPATGARLGYISSYHEGVRENGGQYTHAAVWYTLALITSGRNEEAFDALMLLNPIARLHDKEMVYKYKGEPYVLAADIYTSPKYYGRMGWSWYTGSAAWYYRAALALFGVSVKNRRLTFEPRLPKKLDKVNLEYRYKDAVYLIKLVRKSESAFYLDGLRIDGGMSVPLKESGRHKIEIHVV